MTETRKVERLNKLLRPLPTPVWSGSGSKGPSFGVVLPDISGQTAAPQAFLLGMYLYYHAVQAEIPYYNQ